MSSVLKVLRNSCRSIETSAFKSLLPIKKIAMSCIILSIVLAASYIIKHIILGYRKTQESFMESQFNNACFKSKLPKDKKTLERINSQQFSSLKAFMKGEISFKSLDFILKFGLEDVESLKCLEKEDKDIFLDNHSVMSENIVLNPALFDTRRTFKYNLEQNSILDFSQSCIDRSTEKSLGKLENSLSTEDKVLYTALGIIGVRNSEREISNQAQSSDDYTVKKQSYEELSAYRMTLIQYIKIYIDLCEKENADIDSVIEVVGDTLLDKEKYDEKSWSDKVEIDKTSLLLMLKMSKGLQGNCKSYKKKVNMIIDMVLDKADFNNILESSEKNSQDILLNKLETINRTMSGRRDYRTLVESK